MSKENEVKVLRANTVDDGAAARGWVAEPVPDNHPADALIITGIEVPEWVPSPGDEVECPNIQRRLTVGSTPFIDDAEPWVGLKVLVGRIRVGLDDAIEVKSLRPVQPEKVAGEQVGALNCNGDRSIEFDLPEELAPGRYAIVRVEDEGGDDGE